MKLDDSAFLNYGRPSTKIKSSNPLYQYLLLLEKYCELSFINDTSFSLDYSGSNRVKGGTCDLNTLSSLSLSKHAKKLVGEKGSINIETRVSPYEKCLSIEFSFDQSHFYANRTKINSIIQYMKQQPYTEILLPSSTIVHLEYNAVSTASASTLFKGLNDLICKLFNIFTTSELLDKIRAFWQKLAPLKETQKYSLALRLRDTMFGKASSRICTLSHTSPSEAQTAIERPTYVFRPTKFMPHCLDKDLISYFEVMQDCTKAIKTNFEKIKNSSVVLSLKADYNQTLAYLREEWQVATIENELFSIISALTRETYPYNYLDNNVEKIRQYILS